MARKKTLADYWSLVLLFFALLLTYYGYQAPQDDEAIFYYVLGAIFLVGFLIVLYWSKRHLGEFFSNLSGGR
jgi:Na+/proline symporter